jgi:NADPH2:quinone reductase
MKAAAFGVDGLEIRDIAIPQPRSTQILVRVHYASLNRRDLTRAKGDEGTVPGLDWAGEVAEVGADVSEFRRGDRVMCMGSGGYAEYAVTEARQALPIPPGLDERAPAALPLALFRVRAPGSG